MIVYTEKREGLAGILFARRRWKFTARAGRKREMKNEAGVLLREERKRKKKRRNLEETRDTKGAPRVTDVRYRLPRECLHLFFFLETHRFFKLIAPKSFFIWQKALLSKPHKALFASSQKDQYSATQYRAMGATLPTKRKKRRRGWSKGNARRACFRRAGSPLKTLSGCAPFRQSHPLVDLSLDTLSGVYFTSASPFIF